MSIAALQELVVTGRKLSKAGFVRPLVVGASGQVGTALVEALRSGGGADGGAVRVLRSSRADVLGQADGGVRLELGALGSVDQAARLLDGLEPDAVFCPGAMTFVDGCEAEPELAWRVNVQGPAVLAAYARRQLVPFVYFSSDYVFSGRQEMPGPYAEDALTEPLSVYGETKLAGERAVLEAHPEALIVRTSWVYGPDPGGKNFVTSLRRQLEAGQKVRVPEDQVSTPTLNRELARITLALALRGASGVVHVAGPELMSRLELARAVARYFGLDEGLVEGVATTELQQRALRPLHSGLRSTRLGLWLGEEQPVGLAEGLGLTAQAAV